MRTILVRATVSTTANPDLLAGPETDKGILPNLKFPFSDAHNRLEKAGWAREVTQRELPVAKSLAGVNMRLVPGAIRELHWHRQAEWAYMLAGRARITAVDQDGHNFIADVDVGDLWYFPPGIPHSIQALKEGCEFLLVFNDGNFSESGTFLISEWFSRTPKEVLAANFNAESSQFSDIPTQGKVPGPIEVQSVASPYGPAPQSFCHRLMAQHPMESGGGTVRIADSKNFPVATQVAAALVEVVPGGMRELHWHPNADEWQYYIEGQARMTVFGAENRARTFDYQAGDVGYVPFPMGHYVQNRGRTPLRFLEIFASDHFEDVSLKQWMALTPTELVQEHLHLGRKALASLKKEKHPVTK